MSRRGHSPGTCLQTVKTRERTSVSVVLVSGGEYSGISFDKSVHTLLLGNGICSEPQIAGPTLKEEKEENATAVVLCRSVKAFSPALLDGMAHELEDSRVHGPGIKLRTEGCCDAEAFI